MLGVLIWSGHCLILLHTTTKLNCFALHWECLGGDLYSTSCWWGCVFWGEVWKKELTLSVDVRQCPSRGNRHRLRNRILSVHICGHDSSCRTVPSRVPCNLSNPGLYCTYLSILFQTNNNNNSALEIRDERGFL